MLRTGSVQVFDGSTLLTTGFRLSDKESSNRIQDRSITLFSLNRNRQSKIQNSFDDLIRPRQHIGWDGEADLLRGFQVDHKLELHRLLHRELSGLGTFKNLVDVGRGP